MSAMSKDALQRARHTGYTPCAANHRILWILKHFKFMRFSTLLGGLAVRRVEGTHMRACTHATLVLHTSHWAHCGSDLRVESPRPQHAHAQDELYTFGPLFSIMELLVVLLYLGHFSGCFFYLLSTPPYQTAGATEVQNDSCARKHLQALSGMGHKRLRANARTPLATRRAHAST